MGYFHFLSNLDFVLFRADDNECSDPNLNDCDRKRTNCIDTADGYECKCKRGYTGHCDACLGKF